jgi:F-type H+-transporting ATPase subunit delta
MMTSATVVNRYAHALADVIVGPASQLSPADAVAQLRLFDASASAVPALQKVLASPAVPKARKRIVIRSIAAAIGLQQIIVNFLLVLSDHRRWAALHEVIEALDSVIDEHLGFERTEVCSAFELSDPQREELARELERLAGRKIRLRLSVDPNLIGGVTARVGSTVYDGSVRGQLAKLRLSLTANRY